MLQSFWVPLHPYHVCFVTISLPRMKPHTHEHQKVSSFSTTVLKARVLVKNAKSFWCVWCTNVLFARMGLNGWLQEVRTQCMRLMEVRMNEQRRTRKMRGTSSPVCMRAFNTRTRLLSHYTFRECIYSWMLIGVRMRSWLASNLVQWLSMPSSFPYSLVLNTSHLLPD